MSSASCWRDSPGALTTRACSVAMARAFHVRQPAVLPVQHPATHHQHALKFGREDLHCAITPVLAALAAYNRSLEHELKGKLILCFEHGLKSRTSQKRSASWL